MVLLRKLKKILTEQFPPPDKVSLEEQDGVIGVIASARFKRMSSIDRQNLIGDLLAAHLTPAELRQVQVIVGVTPDEEAAYSSG
jgi:acid stress-induced BolA-like protein IbaG/YrbA